MTLSNGDEKEIKSPIDMGDNSLWSINSTVGTEGASVSELNGVVSVKICSQESGAVSFIDFCQSAIVADASTGETANKTPNDTPANEETANLSNPTQEEFQPLFEIIPNPDPTRYNIRWKNLSLMSLLKPRVSEQMTM